MCDLSYRCDLWWHVGEAEVHDLDALVLVEQQVLGLQVAVHHVELMDFLHPGDDLVEKATGLDFTDALVLHDVVEELPTGGVFHNEVEPKKDHIKRSA